MTHTRNIAKTLVITAFMLLSGGLVVTSVAHAAEVTGTLNGGASIGNTITGTVGGGSGSTVSGTVGGGTSGGSTVTGTVSSGGGGGGSGGGGNTLGGGIITNDPQGIVLGASTNVSNVPGGNTGSGAVLGVSTGVPNTGAGGNAMVTLLFILTLSLVAGTSTYVVSRRVIR